MKPLAIALAALLASALAQEASVLAADDALTQSSLEVFSAYAGNHDPSHFAEDAVFHDMTLPEPIIGREAIGEMLAAIYAVGFPGAEPETKSITAAGTRVIMEFVFHGTNTGSLFGNEPTGRTIAVPMIAVYEIRDGLIQEVWLYYDGASYARQLGWLE